MLSREGKGERGPAGLRARGPSGGRLKIAALDKYSDFGII
jgi:hypothetical protein